MSTTNEHFVFALRARCLHLAIEMLEDEMDVHRDRVRVRKHDAGKIYLLLNMNYENEMNRIIAFASYLNVIISN